MARRYSPFIHLSLSTSKKAGAWLTWSRRNEAIISSTARIGCQVSGDGDYGIRSSLPWAMGYPHGTVPTPAGVTVQPTPIYETVAMSLLAYGLWRLRDRVRPGVVFALYLLLSGLERFLVEFIRRNSEVLAGLTAPQLESIALCVIGSVMLVAMARGGGVSGLRTPTAGTTASSTAATTA